MAVLMVVIILFGINVPEPYIIVGSVLLLGLILWPILFRIVKVSSDKKTEIVYYVYLFGEEAMAFFDKNLGQGVNFIVNNKEGEFLKKKHNYPMKLSNALEAVKNFPVKILGKEVILWANEEMLLSDYTAISLEHEEYEVLRKSEIVNLKIVVVKCNFCSAAIEADISKEAQICSHCGKPYITEKAIGLTIEKGFDNEYIEKNIEKGEAMLEDKEWGKAMEIFADIIRIRPNDYRGWLNYVRSDTHNFTRPSSNVYSKLLKKALLVANDEEKLIIKPAIDDYAKMRDDVWESVINSKRFRSIL